jgi:hypothetical protein
MKLRFLQLSLLLSLAAIPAWAQTSSELNSKYGVPTQSYEIRPGIFLTVKYAADGQACEMAVEKRHVRASGTIDLDSTTLSSEEKKMIVEDLIPVAKRGKRSEVSGDIAIIGGGGTESDDYENISITYYSNYSPSKNAIIRGTVAIVIRWKGRTCKES